MFILRRISGKGIEINQSIGVSYTYVGKDLNYEDFSKAFESYFGFAHRADLDEESNSDTKQCYAFILGDLIDQPLYKDQKNFIMTECGRTFENLTFK